MEMSQMGRLELCQAVGRVRTVKLDMLCEVLEL